MYIPSLMLMALHEERVLGVERRAVRPAWHRLGRGLARRRLARSDRTRAGTGRAGLLTAGAGS